MWRSSATDRLPKFKNFPHRILIYRLDGRSGLGGVVATALQRFHTSVRDKQREGVAMVAYRGGRARSGSK